MSTKIIQEICQDKIFISNLIEVSRKNDNELKKFVDKNLFPQKSKLSMEAINLNISKLSSMDEKQQLLLIARAKLFKENADPSKFYPHLFGLFGIVVSVYAILKDITIGNVYVSYFSLIALTLMGANLAFILISLSRRRSTALFFSSIINSNLLFKQ